MKESYVLILDPRGNIVTGGKDVVMRHIKYASFLSKLNLEVFSTSSLNQRSVKQGMLRITRISDPTINALKFAREASKKLQVKKLDIKLLSVGDPWESYWSAYFLNKFLSQKIPIQIQLHGDIANPLWRKINLKNRLRFWLAKFSVPRADLIRVVSKYQAELLTKHFRVDKDRIEVIPVPISNLNLIPKSLSKSSRTVGFFGRIHQDRGIWEFLNLIKKLNTQAQDFKIIIAGDGPDKEKFLSQLYEILPKSRVSFLGHIPEKELRKVWRRVGVLVSLAPVESYGRVMREALVAGVPVWARSSSGVKDLMDKCEMGTVKIIDLNKSASELSKDFEVLLKTKVGPKFAKAFIKENDTYAEKLAQSWIKTINKSKKA